MRSRAVSRINDALQPGRRVLVTCRTGQYRDAIRPANGPESALSGAAVIQLRPLNTRAVRRYLRDDAAGPVTRTRWDPVLELLGTQAPAGQALSMPLIIPGRWTAGQAGQWLAFLARYLEHIATPD